jgi:hypothetical protein
VCSLNHKWVYKPSTIEGIGISILWAEAKLGSQWSWGSKKRVTKHPLDNLFTTSSKSDWQSSYLPHANDQHLGQPWKVPPDCRSFPWKWQSMSCCNPIMSTQTSMFELLELFLNNLAVGQCVLYSSQHPNEHKSRERI